VASACNELLSRTLFRYTFCNQISGGRNAILDIKFAASSHQVLKESFAKSWRSSIIWERNRVYKPLIRTIPKDQKKKLTAFQSQSCRRRGEGCGSCTVRSTVRCCYTRREILISFCFGGLNDNRLDERTIRDLDDPCFDAAESFGHCFRLGCKCSLESDRNTCLPLADRSG